MAKIDEGAAFCSAGIPRGCAEARTSDVPRFRALPEEVKPLRPASDLSISGGHRTVVLLELFGEPMARALAISISWVNVMAALGVQ